MYSIRLFPAGQTPVSMETAAGLTLEYIQSAPCGFLVSSDAGALGLSSQEVSMAAVACFLVEWFQLPEDVFRLLGRSLPPVVYPIVFSFSRQAKGEAAYIPDEYCVSSFNSK